MATRGPGGRPVSEAAVVSHAYCAARSDGLEQMQKLTVRRLEGQERKLEELTKVSIQLTAAVDRATLILEKQDVRLERVENRSPFAFLETQGGKTLLRFLGIGLLLLLCAGLGVNIFQLLREVSA